jgi:hypothetical protein
MRSLATISAISQRLSIAHTSPTTTLILSHQLPSIISRRKISTEATKMNTEPKTMNTEPYSPGDTLFGESGRTYTIQKVLAERRKPLLCVYKARYDLKFMSSSPGEY